MTGELVHLGWMVVALVATILFSRWAGRFERSSAINMTALASIQAIQQQLCAWPEPEELIGRIDALEVELKKVNASGLSLPAIVSRANDLTKDMLEVRRLVAEHREMLQLLRSKGSLRALTGVSE